MATAVIFKKLKSLLLVIVTVFKRALCCFRRRRRNSEFIPLTQIDIVSGSVESAEYQNWSNWNDDQKSENYKPSSIQEHIEYYRQQAIAARQAQEDSNEAPENFFEDMVPTITKQTKVYINTNSEEKNTSNRLSLVPESNLITQELEEWDENNGWEEQTLDYDAKEALKENRKLARQKKIWEQQQKKDKIMKPMLGAKVSS